MTIKNNLQALYDKLEKSRRKLTAANDRGDKASSIQFTLEIKQLTKEIESNKQKQSRDLGDKANKIMQLKFKRALTKAEQADMGKLKKSVRGLEVVHPMTKLGKQMGIQEVTGFAPTKF
ncbi:YibL family ribosome-associated protein [Paraferrimonas sp. SM1919]|uniref:YibL family ribosome-associated protein n=1 Tax=Paraferrimonas sp. SM1919 TaxID=2662263 RepID=UPI0013D6375F|nr:YibL family ribosome-associated protein [Paraferrimonas sp. SM1919]